MKSWLYPGARVVCRQGGTVARCIEPLVYGQIYTVREAGMAADKPVVCVLVEEIVNERSPLSGLEYGYEASRFRPLTKRSTDTQVSKLKRLLNTTPADLEREGV